MPESLPLTDGRLSPSQVDQYWRDGFQRADEKIAEQHRRARSVRRDQGQGNAGDDADCDLQYETARHDAAQNVDKTGSCNNLPSSQAAPSR